MDELRCYFKKIHNQLDTGFTRALQKHELTCTQFDLMLYLSQNTGKQTTLTDISTHFGVKHTSVIHVLKILEKKELILKSASADARAKVITLTDNGRQTLEEFVKRKPLLNEIMFAGLSDNDLKILKKMLKQIHKNLESDAFQTF
ncbi:MAG: MarR family transcriptional regulator [Eubacterium sp.]|nr:MarR family transcriptional regulator [Eubacterium sp.]